MRAQRSSFEEKLKAARERALRQMAKYEAAVGRGMGKVESRAILSEATVFDKATVCLRDAKVKYCLNNRQLECLKYVSYQNPHDPTWSPMKLYRKADLLGRAVAIYGSAENLRAELAKRKKSREKRAVNAAAKRAAAGGAVPRRAGKVPVARRLAQ